MDTRTRYMRSLRGLIDKWQVYFKKCATLPKATMDFETRSACDLKKHGSWLYSKHPSTEPMCLMYKLPGESKVRRWHMAHPHCGIDESDSPHELFAFILAGGLIEAHNSFFEKVIWRNVMIPRFGWPDIPNDQWRCSAAKASAASLPRDLDKAGQAMRLSTTKNKDGHRLMLKMSKPRKPRKAEVQAWAEEHALEDTIPEMPLLWHEDEEDIRGLWQYCEDDVLSEEALSEAIPELSEKELRVWQLDQEYNERGVMFDLEMAHAALAAAAAWRKVLNKELYEMTGISAATKRQQVKDWLAEHEDLALPDTKGDTLDWYLDRVEMSGRARRIIQIVKQVNRTSTRKYQAMLDRVDPDDGRARDLLMYHGAGTGRWTGKGIQIHNFPRGESKNAWGEYGPYFDMDRACEDVLEGDVEWMGAMAGDVMELLSSALRGAIVSPEGKDLMVADYSAIEARVVLWLAGADGALDVFRRGGDIYCDMAEGIYGYPVHKKTHAEERQFGKQAILGLGFGMGFITFLLNSCRRYGIHFSIQQCKHIMGARYADYYSWVEDYLFPKPTGNPQKDANKKRQAARVRRRLEDEREKPRAIIHELALMKYTVDIYRNRYPEVKQMWKDQEVAAMSAVRQWETIVKTKLKELGKPFSWLQTPEGTRWRDAIDGPEVPAGKVVWDVKGGFMRCRLPSGRYLYYRDPQIKPTKTSWGETKDGLRYMSVVTGNKWARTATYGGKLVENITQAVARDIMADAFLRCADTEYAFLMSVHDEMVMEIDEDKGSKTEFEELMSTIEPWAVGCPITAEADRFKRYRK